MEIDGFLSRPQHTFLSVKFLSWNINGCRTKLEKKNVENLLLQYDIIALNEVKTHLPVCLPGYTSYMSYDKDNSHRGGTTVLVKNYLSREVISMDTSITDQVWFQLRNIPKIVFGACYIPPSDSPFFSHMEFASIQEKLISETTSNRYIIFGDMNARLGRCVRDIVNNNNFTYPNLPDDVITPNDNAYLLSTICKDHDLVVINNLKTGNKHFVSDRTYRQGTNWVSELDVFVGSQDMIGSLDWLKVYQTVDLPSDHAPIGIQISVNRISLDDLARRASNLGGHASLMGCLGRNGLVNKPLKACNIDSNLFSALVANRTISVEEHGNSIDDFASRVSELLYRCAEMSFVPSEPITENGGIVYNDRWERLLQDHDDSSVWKAIDWKGRIGGATRVDDHPTDQEFKEFFERVLNPIDIRPVGNEISSDVNIPILDNQITSEEVQTQIRKIKPNKSCGPDGVSPGVLKMLPPQWILTLATLFSTIFTSSSYPGVWSLAKLFTIFKKGDRRNPKNYRGITVINCLAKLYDMILCARLETWFKPYREQAGAQKGRGCVEHIVTLRLLTDFAKKKKNKLFVVFVDFTQAYDLVPRDMLFQVLKRLGCGTAMLAALIAIYRVTNSVIGTAVVATTIGVRQGSSTSCLLFILYINDLIKLIKESCNPEGFLSWLHILALMDDTVLLATTRENILHKISLLKQYCQDYGMKINASKTKFFVICGTDQDREIIEVDDLIIEQCTKYVYLGSVFTADGSVSSSVAAHAQSRVAHLNKFVSFLDKNNDIPFIVKKRVFDAVLMSTILYGCESWLNADLRPIVKLYNWAVKLLLGVRKTTCNDTCYLELGLPPLQDLVRSRQRKFFSGMWRERSLMEDDPLVLIIKTVLGSRYNTRNYVQSLIYDTVDDIGEAMENLKNNIRNSNSSRRLTYMEMNPDLSVHNVYSEKHNIPEHHRVSFTRFRLSAHSLAVEVGRWNRRGRGRLPVEERLCRCGEIQTENHVVRECPLTLNIRLGHNIDSISSIFSNERPIADQCRIVHLFLLTYN